MTQPALPNPSDEDSAAKDRAVEKKPEVVAVEEVATAYTEKDPTVKQEEHVHQKEEEEPQENGCAGEEEAAAAAGDSSDASDESVESPEEEEEEEGEDEEEEEEDSIHDRTFDYFHDDDAREDHTAPPATVLTDLVTGILSNDEHLFWAMLPTSDVNKVDASGCTPLHYAAFVGNAGFIEALIEYGARVDAKDNAWVTPLHRAVQKNNEGAVDRLLSAGANHGIQCKLWQTPLHVAAIHNSLDAAKLLLQLSSEFINRSDHASCTALHHAAYYGNTQIADLLLEFGADLTIQDNLGRTAVHWAAIGGSVDILKLFMMSRADLVARDKHGRTPLHYAASSGKVGAIEWLLRRTTETVDVPDSDGFTPLHYATRNGFLKAVVLLVENSANFRAASANGLTMAHIASGYTENLYPFDYLVSELCRHELDDGGITLETLEAKCSGGFTPLHMACDRERIGTVDGLIRCGVDPDAPADDDIRPLHVAALGNHLLAVKHLITGGASINSRMKGGLTPLHVGCKLACGSAVQGLISLKADVNATDERNRTPLHIAAWSTEEHADFCVTELLKTGANPRAIDSDGRTPLHMASARGNGFIVDKLIRAGVDTEAVDSRKRTALHYAVLHKHNSKAIQALCRTNPRLVEMKDSDGFYPVHFAAYRGNANLVSFLLNEMSCAEAPSSGSPHHFSPLHIAVAHNHPSVVKALLQTLRKNADTVDQRYRGGGGGYRRSGGTLAERVGTETDFRRRLPFHYAMQFGFLECAKALLEPPSSSLDSPPSERASISGRRNLFLWEDKWGITPLHLAAANGHAHAVQWAIEEANVGVLKTDSMKRTCGMLGITAKLESSVLRRVLEKSVLHATDSNGRGYLHRAVAVGDRALVLELLHKECSIDTADANDVSPLHVAASLGDRGMVALLLSEGADPRKADTDGLLPADWAASAEHTECLDELAPLKMATLLPSDEERHHDDSDGDVPIDHSPTFTPSSILLAATAGHLNCVCHLLSTDGALCNVRDARGRTPLHQAAYRAKYDCVELLVASGAAVDARDERGRTPLMLAAKQPDAIHVFKYLLGQTASVSAMDVDGNSTLHLACDSKNEDAVLLLIAQMKQITCDKEREALFNAANKNGMTPMHLMALNGLTRCLVKIAPFAMKSLWLKDDHDRPPVTCAIEDPDVADCTYLLACLMSIKETDGLAEDWDADTTIAEIESRRQSMNTSSFLHSERELRRSSVSSSDADYY